MEAFRDRTVKIDIPYNTRVDDEIKIYEKDFNTGRVRWGDYSSTEVDPVDDATFWTIQEYAGDAVGPNENDQRWGTWWSSIANFDTVGACCSSGGICLGNLDYAACAALGATIHADEDCNDFPCPVLRTSCDSAADLACNRSVTLDNRSISNPAQPPFSCGFAVPYDGTVWFKFIATDTTARLSTCGSVGQDSALAVYDGECTALTELGCSEDDCGLKGFLSDLAVENLTPGESYFVQMSVFTPSDRGVYTLELLCPGCRTSLPPEPDPFLTDAGSGTKNRYVSFLDVNTDRRVAYRLKFLNMPAGFEAFEGETMWVGNPALLSESPGNLFPFQAPGAETFQAATLQCTPRFKDWSRLGVIHVTHPLIVPGAVYALQAIGDLCPTDSEERFSADLVVATSRWGDISRSYAELPYGPPDGSVDIPDVLAILSKFVAAPGAPIKARADLKPALPDRLINIDDALAAIQGFVGLGYPFAPPPHPCP
ncbi:MAG: hypothetical protein IH989_05050 [Planctomycetes bacterium]|nr:hypothetical protein [Planctomycetota bacterium]